MKLHLGCGKRQLAGYVHVDLADFPHIDLRTSVDNLEFFKSETVEEIYSSHTFEYFDRMEAPKVLGEWHRVLKPEGRLYVTVPDFDSLIKVYQESNSLNKIIGPLFGRWIIGENLNPIFHKTVWNEIELSTVLEGCGFKSVERFDPVEYLSAIDSNYDDHSLAFFPHMNRKGIQVSLALCAVK
jgi:SAM-dependent methyltransferase